MYRGRRLQPDSASGVSAAHLGSLICDSAQFPGAHKAENICLLALKVNELKKKKKQKCQNVGGQRDSTAGRALDCTWQIQVRSLVSHMVP